jgi:DNA repair exonuclease SbcCD ATPase subunit
MLWEPVEPAQQPELAVAESVDSGFAVSADVSLDEIVDEGAYEPMIASLEDALTLLAAANDARDVESRRQRSYSSERTTASASRATRSSMPMRATAFAEPDDSLAALVARALSAPLSTHNNLEAVALQGILIQKESAMTEVEEAVTTTEPQGKSVPITSAELQEVAATLSVPKVEADPDDVLSDVQNTLNSLAGMAQGLTQQKQAAGRLQDELEEWNNQLLERERLAGDKEARLAQLDEHLLQAKTNLDRLAAENNRLLTERSEALKQLAQSVDQRDRSTLKRAEAMQVEQQRIDELAATLRSRASELDERESSLKRKSEELAVRLKQLQSAKDKFSAIVKSFNETVQFNTTLSAISKSVTE